MPPLLRRQYSLTTFDRDKGLHMVLQWKNFRQLDIWVSSGEGGGYKDVMIIALTYKATNKITYF
jgi:hypothetical protein